MASGANRVDEKAVGRLLGERLERADADFVRAKTGFAIGGVPPVGHSEAPVCFIDADLMALGEIWAAAGTSNAVFRLTHDTLVELTVGRVAEIKKGALTEATFPSQPPPTRLGARRTAAMARKTQRKTARAKKIT